MMINDGFYLLLLSINPTLILQIREDKKTAEETKIIVPHSPTNMPNSRQHKIPENPSHQSTNQRRKR